MTVPALDPAILDPALRRSIPLAPEPRPAAQAATRLVTREGEVIDLPVARWVGEATAEEHEVLARAIAPVLDVGCGPGRHVVALAEAGISTLGIDMAPHALAMARARGAAVLERSVFDHVPCAGRWATALLFDGNIGIGGDPAGLLRRLTCLLRSPGRVLVELEPPGTRSRVVEARLVVGDGSGAHDGDSRDGGEQLLWFPWAQVGVDDAAAVAAEAGLVLEQRWQGGERWFGQIQTP